TVNPELAAEVSQAYQKYWHVRAEALFELDPSRLPVVVAGDHLAALEERIVELRSESRAIDTDVEHKYAVIEASGDEAKVADTYVDHSVYIDVRTHGRLTSPTDQVLNELYGLRKSDGSWRVVSLVRSP